MKTLMWAGGTDRDPDVRGYTKISGNADASGTLLGP